MKQFLKILFFVFYVVPMNFAFAEDPNSAGCEPKLQPAGEIEAVFQEAFREQIDKDLAFLYALQADPATHYFDLREKAQQAIASGETDFPFEPHRAVVERIAGDTKQRQTRKFGKKYQERLETVHQKALFLLSKGQPPYAATIRFVMYEYLPLVDDILGERHPELMKNEFHRHHAEHLVESFLNSAPDMFLFLSFEYTNDDFFVDSRPALMNLIGINLQGLDDDLKTPFADNWPMKNSEFSWHDWGHADFTSHRDLMYIRSGGKPIERVVWEWEFTRRRIKAVVDQVRLKDVNLAEAMNQLLFELLRERGFQFSLTVLKQEFDTPKWVETIERKYAAKFYDHGKTNHAKFKRLEEARVLLLQAVERIREADQLKWIDAIHAHLVPAKLTYTPQLGYAKARLDNVEIVRYDHVLVHCQNDKPITTDIREMISAQVDPTKTSPLTPEVIKKIEELLWFRDQKMSIKTPVEADLIQSIRVTKDKMVLVELVSGRFVKLDQVAYLNAVPEYIPRMPNLEVFKINQVLGTEERNQDQAFTIRQPVQIFTGTIKTTENLISGHYDAEILTIDGQTLHLPLMQIRVDPLHDSSKDE